MKNEKLIIISIYRKKWKIIVIINAICLVSLFFRHQIYRSSPIESCNISKKRLNAFYFMFVGIGFVHWIQSKKSPRQIPCNSLVRSQPLAKWMLLSNNNCCCFCYCFWRTVHNFFLFIFYFLFISFIHNRTFQF